MIVLDAGSILKSLVKLIGPTKNWKGQCFAVASQAVKHGVVKGDAVYGMWHGPIAKGSFFEERGQRVPFVNHGWINLQDGLICDPTRWVFENVRPYIYIGTNDHYDEGANRLREHQPPPSWDPGERIIPITQDILDGHTWRFIEELLQLPLHDETYQLGTITLPQLFWIANRSPAVLGEFAPALYGAFDKLKFGAAVPFDNRLAVKRRFAKD